MILGVSKISWIEQLTRNQLNDYFKLIDKLLVVVDTPEDVWQEEDRIFYRQGDYESILSTLNWWQLCKAYPRKTLFSINFALVEIPEGCYAEDLKRRWLNELRGAGIL